jgi:hypothetical protein
VLLDLHCLMEHGIGIVVGRLGTLVGRGRQHITRSSASTFATLLVCSHLTRTVRTAEADLAA